jgi:hypothetical protein
MRFNETTYDSAIAMAKFALNLENSTDHDPWLFLLADECMRSINDRAIQELRTETIPLDEGTAPLPCGFLRAMAVWFQSSTGPCTLAPYVDRNIVNFCNCGTGGVNLTALGTTYQVNGNHIVFHNPDAISAEEVSLAYLGMRLDANNQPVVLESHVRAIVAYLTWRFKTKMGPTENNLGTRNIMRSEAMDAKREYMAQRRFIEGESNKRQWDEDKKSIGRTFNAWITRHNKRGMFSMP